MRFESFLEKLGFNKYLLSSMSYNISRLRKLKKPQVRKIKKALIDCHHFFLLKNVLSDKEYHLKNEDEKWRICAKKFKKIRIERLAQLLSIVARLLQVKVYLIWKRNKGATGDGK
ncbi:MAG: hypothetical protein ACUVTD_05650 [Nitrososphaerales archaeon]